MNFALYENKKVSAEEYKKSDNLDLRCPCCNSEVLAKQGEINIWHFAHKVKNRCSEWFKPMTEWHSNWQKCFPNECREVIHKCEKTGEKHIADIKTKSGIVIEFQHSSISSKEIKAREEFYGEKMIWVLDGNVFKCEHYEFDKYNYKFSVDYMLKKNEDLIKRYDEELSKPFGCHKDFIFEYLKKGMEFYRHAQNMIKGYPKSKFFKIAKNHIFIDLGDYMLYLKRDENKNFIVEHKDFIYTKNHEYWQGDYSKIKITYDWELADEDYNPFEYSEIENLFGLKILKLKSELFTKISKAKFLEKYAAI